MHLFTQTKHFKATTKMKKIARATITNNNAKNQYQGRTFAFSLSTAFHFSIFLTYASLFLVT